MVDSWVEERAEGVLAELVMVDSTSFEGSEAAVGRRFLGLLGELGCPVPDGCVREVRHDARRSSFVVTLPGERDDVTVCLAGHLDTVPTGDPASWTHPPLSAHVADGSMWGRGTVDMKGGDAAMLLLYASYAARGERPPVTLRLCLTADEESAGTGACALDEAGAFDDLAFLLICEPTGCAPGTCEKGCLWATLDVRGSSSHASMPERGVNALEHGFAVAARARSLVEGMLPPHALLGGGTCTLTVATGGDKVNVVPDAARLVLDTRFLPGTTSAAVGELIRGAGREREEACPGLSVSVSCDNCREALEVDEAAPGVAAAMAACAAEGASDASHGVMFYTDGSIVLPRHPGLPFLILGPGDPAQCHRVDEHIARGEVVRALRIYRRWLDGCGAWL